MATCLYLHDSYIIKFDFMNYAFAKLVVAWLYIASNYKRGHNEFSLTAVCLSICPFLHS